MIVLCAGMQKAGSAWFFNLANDMLVEAGCSDVRELRRRFRLGRFLTAANCNIDRPTWWKLMPVSVPQLLGHSYAIKTHEAPTAAVRTLMRLNVLRPSYIFRDPRDVLVSLMDHAERIRDSNVESATGFDGLETVEAAVEFVAHRLTVWQEWTETSGVLITRYEDLVRAPVDECARLADFLGLRLEPPRLEAIVERHSAKRAKSGETPYPLHFNQGVSGRWRQVLTGAQQRICAERFGAALEVMGYAS